MPIEANGLRFRTSDAQDVDLHLRLYNDPLVRQFVGDPLNMSREEAFVAVVDRPAGMGGIFVVEDLSAGYPVGECGFIGNNYIPETDTTVMLLPEYQNSGYGKRILPILFDLWSNVLGKHSLAATIWPDNIAAAALLKACCFQQAGEYTDVHQSNRLVFKRFRKPSGS